MAAKKKELQRNVIQHQNDIMYNFIRCWCGGGIADSGAGMVIMVC